MIAQVDNETILIFKQFNQRMQNIIIIINAVNIIGYNLLVSIVFNFQRLVIRSVIEIEAGKFFRKAVFVFKMIANQVKNNKIFTLFTLSLSLS